MTMWHLSGNLVVSPPAQESMSAAGQSAHTESQKARDSLQQTREKPVRVVGLDGIPMYLAAGGQIQEGKDRLGNRADNTVTASFYLDETYITYYNYVEYLDRNRDGVAVEDSIVKKDGSILIYLDSGQAAYNRIFYEHDRFHLRKPEHAGRPVVRVTWYGAQSYAQYFGKRLPTADEWRYAVKKGLLPLSKENYGTNMQSMHEQMNAQAAIGQSEPEAGETADHLKFWVQLPGKNESSPEASGEKPTAGVQSIAIPLTEAVKRYPWEAFDDVTFWCVKSLSK
jgi:formylglycine-generating enzyme required for sulfatase activity